VSTGCGELKRCVATQARGELAGVADRPALRCVEAHAAERLAGTTDAGEVLARLQPERFAPPAANAAVHTARAIRVA